VFYLYFIGFLLVFYKPLILYFTTGKPRPIKKTSWLTGAHLPDDNELVDRRAASTGSIICGR